jgi:hypothetical protein
MLLGNEGGACLFFVADKCLVLLLTPQRAGDTPSAIASRQQLANG